MSPVRSTLAALLAALTVYCSAWSYRSYEKLQYYTHVEPDYSVAESYEIEVWLKAPIALLLATATGIAVAPLFRRK